MQKHIDLKSLTEYEIEIFKYDKREINKSLILKNSHLLLEDRKN